MPTIEGFVASHQVGVAQLAIEYCNALVESNQAAAFFPGLNFTAAPAVAFAAPTALTDPLVAKGVGINLSTQPAEIPVSPTGRAHGTGPVWSARCRACGGSCASDRTKTITKAACATVLGSAAVLLK